MRGRNEAQELFLIPVVLEIARRGHGRRDAIPRVFPGMKLRGKKFSWKISPHYNFHGILSRLRGSKKNGERGRRKDAQEREYFAVHH